MSNRNDIKDGYGSNSVRSGLIYTCKCGWIDLGHARPDNANDNLWQPILNDKGQSSKDIKGFKIEFSEQMAWGKISDKFGKAFYVNKGLKRNEKESVALSIFMEVSYGFEKMQGNTLYSIFTDSSFSAEDLVSNLVGFYRAVRPGVDYIGLCHPVSKPAALTIWDDYGPVGKNKNIFFGPFLYP